MKKFLVVTVCLCVLISLFGCNNNKDEFSTPGYDVLYGYLSQRAPDEQLHYENTSDLLKETISYVVNDFSSYFS